MAPVAGSQASADATYNDIESLIGRSPDSEFDIPALRCLADVEDPDTEDLAETIRLDPDWRDQPLRELLPGLELVEPARFWDQLGVRACNALRRGEFSSWSDICRASAAEIEEIHGAGCEVVEGTLRATAREWALAHLARWGALEARGDRPAPAAQPPDRGLDDLDAAFAELERTGGFEVFALRRLRPGKVPTYQALALQSGRTRHAHAQRVNRIDRIIKRRMEDQAWPIGIAVRQVERQLGPVALPAELAEVLAGIQHDTGALSKDLPHRRALLLHIAQYRESQEWILGPDIEKLTTAIIAAFAEDGATNVDAIAGPLSAVGIREHLHLPWLASQHGYRIIDGALVPVDV